MISRAGFVLCVVQTQWHTLNQCPSLVDCLVHGFCFEELYMAELSIAKLVYLKADHFNLPAAIFEEIDQVLLSDFHRNISDPDGVPVLWLDTFRPVAATARRLSLKSRICSNLVHVGKVDRYPATVEIFPYHFGRVVDLLCSIELNVRKVATNIFLADTHLCYSATILEKLN